jgi:hypothetical protein
MAIRNSSKIGIPMPMLNIVGSSFLLDDYPNTSGHSYSLRQLSSTVTNVVRVRRTTDNAEQDFTATGLTDGTLDLFCGEDQGHVAKWYDQSNSLNVYNFTALQQPLIYIGEEGGLLLQNGKPCMEFDGVDDTLQVLLPAPYASSYYLFAVNAFVGPIGEDNPGAINPTHMSSYINQSLLTTELKLRGTSDLVGTMTTNPTLQSLYYNRQIDSPVAQSVVNVNGQNISSLAANGAKDINTIHIGSSTIPDGHSKIRLQEFILYFADPASNATAIESNINTHYSIY